MKQGLKDTFGDPDPDPDLDDNDKLAMCGQQHLLLLHDYFTGERPNSDPNRDPAQWGLFLNQHVFFTNQHNTSFGKQMRWRDYDNYMRPEQLNEHLQSFALVRNSNDVQCKWRKYHALGAPFNSLEDRVLSAQR